MRCPDSCLSKPASPYKPIKTRIHRALRQPLCPYPYPYLPLRITPTQSLSNSIFTVSLIPRTMHRPQTSSPPSQCLHKTTCAPNQPSPHNPLRRKPSSLAQIQLPRPTQTHCHLSTTSFMPAAPRCQDLFILASSPHNSSQTHPLRAHVLALMSALQDKPSPSSTQTKNRTTHPTSTTATKSTNLKKKLHIAMGRRAYDATQNAFAMSGDADANPAEKPAPKVSECE